MTPEVGVRVTSRRVDDTAHVTVVDDDRQGVTTFPVDDTTPLVVDLFAGPGGVARGFRRLGFRVLGVDHDPHPAYPGPVLEHDLTDGLPTGLERLPIRYAWASPPCLPYTTLPQADGPELIGLARDLLEKLDPDGAWFLENVPGAREHLEEPVTLTGECAQFRDELAVEKRRLVETSFPWPTSPRKERVERFAFAVSGRESPASGYREAHGLHPLAPISVDDMGDVIPPCYVEALVGQHRFESLEAVRDELGVLDDGETVDERLGLLDGVSTP